MVLIDRILRPLCQARQAGSQDDKKTPFWSSDCFRILAQNLTKVYLHEGQAITALKDISLDVLEGEFLAIVGRSGAGKTSLLNILAGSDQATTGVVRVFGRCPFVAPRREALCWHAQTIGYVPQKPVWIGGRTVLDTLQLPPFSPAGASVRWFDRAMDLLGLLGMSGLASLSLEELTGSERTKLAVARALIAGPRLLLMDQVGRGSDPKTTVEILGVLRQLNARQGTTVIVTASDHRASKFALRTLILSEGVLARPGSATREQLVTKSPCNTVSPCRTD